MLVPLAGPLDADVAENIGNFLFNNVPRWYTSQIVSTAEYLGIWLGPRANTKNWINQISKLIDRTDLIGAAAPPTCIAIGTYNVKAITVLSHPSQFLLPPRISELEKNTPLLNL